MNVRIATLTQMARAGCLAALLAVIAPTTSFAQANTGAAATLPAASAPTTKILAIGRRTAKATPEAMAPVMPTEVRDTVRLYLAGKIDQWYVQSDRSGVVFLMNVTDPDEARTLLANLPLDQAGLMEFQLIPLGPLTPLRMLIETPAK
jgi:hypothetical protein